MAADSVLRAPLDYEPEWPAAAGEGTVFLLDASSDFEARLLRAWIERKRPAEREHRALSIPPARRRRSSVGLNALAECLADGGNAQLVPLRIAWLPRRRDGRREVLLSDIVRFGDPRDPGPLRQRWIARHERDRCRIVLGEAATTRALRERWQDASGHDGEETTSLAEFVARQALLALERGERKLRGERYKVPRFLHEDILARASFRHGLRRLAGAIDQPLPRLQRRAARILKEMAAAHSPFVIDIAARLIRMLYRQGYDEALQYDREALRRVKALGERHPIVFLPSHKSNLDHLVLQYALHENGHAPNHAAGGINMNFFPIGPLLKRSGLFFIRRSFKDDALYKFVLQHYIDYLIEKRFSLEWYIEGGRSRSGKLLPPRFGLLAYVVDAYRRGKAEDVHLIPVSIAYDQIQDVGAYAAEQKGAPKERESFGWFVGVVRRLRRRYGTIHFRFGEPLSLAKSLGHPTPGAEPAPDETSLAIQKLAFEVCVRINRVTPITESSLIALALLGSGFRALSVGETQQALRNILHFVRSRGLPTVGQLDLDSTDGVRRALEALVENRVITRYDAGLEPVYVIGPDQQLAAAYYRNTVVHFFVIPCIVELALLRASEDDVEDRVAGFWDETLRLRDLLKFEFFFAEKEAFRRAVDEELRRYSSDPEAVLRAGSAAIYALLGEFRPFSSHRLMRPFIEAYQIVGDLLAALPAEEEFVEAPFIERCLRVGLQYHLQRRVHSAASVSQVIFRSALDLARNRGLLDTSHADLTARRARLALEIRAVERRIEIIDAMAKLRRSRRSR